MNIRDKDDAILVKIIDDDGKIVSCYNTVAIEQTLKMFITARDYNIYCNFNDNSESVDEEYVNFPDHIIQNVKLKFGSKTDIPVIEVYI